MIELILGILIATLLGILAGTFTGLSPGIHINLVAAILLSISAWLLTFPLVSPLMLVIFIVSMSITHTFTDFIPSIFLGAPNEDTALSTLPGHELLLEGKGYEAVYLTLLGSISAVILAILISPLIFFTLPKIYPFIQRMMGWILIWICIFLIYNEKEKGKTLIIFLLSGFLGIASLNLNINQPLLPLLSGLFGASSLILSVSQKTLLPEQRIESLKIKENLKTLIKPSILSSLVSPIFGFLPGLGSSQAAIISSSIIKIDRKQFLILVGSINTFVMIISFLTLYLINKSRTGSAAIISDIMTLKLTDLFWIYGAIILSSLFCIFVTLKLARLFAKHITRINYSTLSIFIIVFLAVLVFMFSGFLGFFVFLVSTILGLTCNYFNVRKGILMGCLLIPTIFYYIII